MNFSIQPGQTRTATAVFADPQGASDPLIALPTWSSPTAGVTLTPDPAATVNDTSFKCAIAVAAGTPVGQVEIDIDAQVDPDTTVPHVTGKVFGNITGPEDTTVTVTVV